MNKRETNTFFKMCNENIFGFLRFLVGLAPHFGFNYVKAFVLVVLMPVTNLFCIMYNVHMVRMDCSLWLHSFRRYCLYCFVCPFVWKQTRMQYHFASKFEWHGARNKWMDGLKNVAHNAFIMNLVYMFLVFVVLWFRIHLIFGRQWKNFTFLDGAIVLIWMNGI